MTHFNLIDQFRGIFNRPSRSIRTVLQHVEPLLCDIEGQEKFSPSFNGAGARLRSAQVLASDPFLLGFFDGIVFGFVNVFGEESSTKQKNLMCGQTMISLFPGSAEGLDLISSAQEACIQLGNYITDEYKDGARKGAKLVAYTFGADYSGDPDALAAIRLGQQLGALGAGQGILPVGDERGDVIGGMQWMYFTDRFSQRYRNVTAT